MAWVKALSQEKTRQKQPPVARPRNMEGLVEKKELKRLADARPCKTFTIGLGLTTRVVVWTQGATER